LRILRNDIHSDVWKISEWNLRISQNKYRMSGTPYPGKKLQRGLRKSTKVL
jgi:hypothetical protein